MRVSGALLLMGAVALTVPAQAQDWKGMGRVMGKVMDQDGKPIPDATVRLELPGRGRTELKADKKGQWAILGVAGGAWNLDFQAPGYTPKSIVARLSEASTNPPIEVKLEKAAPKGPPPEVLDGIQKGDEAYKGGRYAEAREQYNRALVAYETLPGGRTDIVTNLHMQIARCYSQVRDLVTLDRYEQLKDGIGVPEADKIMGRAGTEHARTADAVSYSWMNPDGSNASATFQAGKLVSRAQAGLRGQQETATDSIKQELEHLQKILDADPTNTQIRKLMMLEAFQGGLLERGVELLNSLDRATLDDPDLYFNIAVSFLNKGQMPETIEYLTRAITLNPSYLDGYYFRGNAYLNQNRLAEAKADYQKFLELAPPTDGRVASVKKVLDQLK